MGENKGKITFTNVEPQGTHEDAGWYYVEAEGVIRANCRDAEQDDSDTKYNEY